MTIQEINNRIQKTNEKIGKIEARIQKWKNAQTREAFVKRDGWLLDLGRDENYLWGEYLKDCAIEVRRAEQDLKDAKSTLEKYHNLLKAEEAKQTAINELPQVVLQFKEKIIKSWDAYDEWKKAAIKEDYRKYIDGANSREEYLANRREMREKWGAGYYDFMYLTSEQIHNANVKAAETIVLNLINRTAELVGKITDCKGLRLDQDNLGYAIINGLIIGEKGKVRIESIGAGGYNIQRYHIRVLVKEVK